MTTKYTRTRDRHDWGTLLAGLIALTALAAAVLLAVSLAPASAETPAERCKRETTAYNNAWKNSWAASHPGKKPSDAPKPPVPYKCGGNNQAPPSIPPTTTTPNDKKGSEETAPEESTNSPHEGPSSAAPTSRRDNQNGTDPGQPTVKNGPTSPSRSDWTTWYTMANGEKIAVYALSRAEALARGLISRATDYLRVKPGPLPDVRPSLRARPAMAMPAPTRCFEYKPEYAVTYRSGAFAMAGTGAMDWCGDGSWVRQWANAMCGGKAYWVTYTYDGCDVRKFGGVNYNLFAAKYQWRFCGANPTARIIDACFYRVVAEADYDVFPNGAVNRTRAWDNR
ncbi:hypothetical protein [Gordonia malaquae]|uniref:hypothetical protein n=1 Tax=Gordonia malaquae TaxID=410332 RepID=UPI0030FF103D